MDIENIHPELQKLLDDAYEIATKKKDYVGALALCDRVLRDQSSSLEALRTRARIQAHAGEFSKAIVDISSAIQQGSLEPDDYFSRGRWYLDNGDPAAAVIDFTRVIDVGLASGFNYYTESAYFFRATALLQMECYDEAISDCEHVRDDFLVFTTQGRVSKAGIISIVQQRRPRTE